MNDAERGFTVESHAAAGAPLDCTRVRGRRARFFSVSAARATGRAGAGGATGFGAGTATGFGGGAVTFATTAFATFFTTFARTFVFAAAGFDAGFFAAGFAATFGVGFGVGFAAGFGVGFTARFAADFVGFGGFDARFTAVRLAALFPLTTTFRAAGLRPLFAAAVVFFTCAFAIESSLPD